MGIWRRWIASHRRSSSPIEIEDARFDPAEIDIKAVVESVERAGYGVVTQHLELPVTGMTCANCAATIERTLNPDRTYTTPNGGSLTLPGRSLLFMRNVGHLMTNPAILTRDGAEIYEGLMDGMITLRAMGLVYTTILALVPLLAVSFSVLKGFGVHNQVEPLLLNLVEPLGDKGLEVVNNVLGFPFIFRGALDVKATAINEEMKYAASQALAALTKEDVPDSVLRAYGKESLKFSREYIIPTPLDPRAHSAIIGRPPPPPITPSTCGDCLASRRLMFFVLGGTSSLTQLTFSSSVHRRTV